MPQPCYIGIDIGTSGCRACAIDGAGMPIAEERAALPAPERGPDGSVRQSPEVWWDALVGRLAALARGLGDAYNPRALAIDATAGTLLLCDQEGRPLTPALMYNDASSADAATRVGECAPAASPARGATASLAKLVRLGGEVAAVRAIAAHQADWIAWRLGGRCGVSDWNNALRLGYDPAAEAWPDWIERIRPAQVALPDVVAPGTPIGRLAPAIARATGLSESLEIRAGTTDSTAAVIATGVRRPGEAVTVLGSTLVVKIVSEAPIFAPEYGVYSHRLGAMWLAGGASNSGGAVLRLYYTDEDIVRLGRLVQPDHPTGLDYYPLPAPGERFPVADPALAPRCDPRPDDPLRFYQGLLEGMAGIESAGYGRLEALGAPAPTHVLTTGGGASNPGWTRIRERALGVPVAPAPHREAAYGAALLAAGLAFAAPDP